MAYLDKDGVGKIFSIIKGDFALKNGSYDNLNAGTSNQLISTTYVEDKVPYNFRTTGGSNDVGDRVKALQLVGGTFAYNQKLSNGDFDHGTTNWTLVNASVSVSDKVATMTATASSGNIFNTATVYANHKYLFTAQVKANTTAIYLGVASIGRRHTNSTTAWQTLSYIYSPSSTAATSLSIIDSRGDSWDAVQIRNCMVIDLTLMFGSAIADYIYTLEQGTTGAGVAWFKNLFPENYYPFVSYTGGILVSTKASKKINTMFNQWDEEWEVGGILDSNGTSYGYTDRIRSKFNSPIRVIPNTNYYIKVPTGNAFDIFFYDTNQNFISSTGSTAVATFTTPSNCAYIRFCLYSTYGTTYNHDICINLSWSGYRNGEYEAFKQYEYNLPNEVLRGIPKLDGDNNLYFDGDYIEPDGTKHVRYGIVNLGSLNWEYSNGYFACYNFPSDRKTSGWGTPIKALCSKYRIGQSYGSGDSASFVDKRIYPNFSTANTIYIKDTSYTDAATFKTAMSGVRIVYELATETTETVDAYQELQIVNDFGTEEIVCIEYNEHTAADGSISLPCGHDSDYYNNLRDKLQRLPEMPTNDGYYAVHYTSRQCEFVDLSAWLVSNVSTILASVSGYDATKTQTLKNDQGTLKWIDD